MPAVNVEDTVSLTSPETSFQAVPRSDSPTLETVLNGKTYKPWQFKPGHKGGPGRPKGRRDFKTILSAREQELADAYIDSALKGSAAVNVDSRKVLAPVESDGGLSGGNGQPVRAFLAQHLTLIMQQPPSLLMGNSVVGQPGGTATPPTVDVSAGTGGETRPPTPPPA